MKLTTIPAYPLIVFFLFLPTYANKKGSLTITSDPSEAKVWIDDSFVGTTPIRQRPLSPGNHTVRVLDEVSQITRTESVTIVADSSSILHVTLERQFGGLKVTTNPPGATVIITSKIGTTPLLDEQIIPGAYTLEIHPASKRDGIVKKDVIITPNALTEVNEKLPRNHQLNGLQIGLRVGLGCLAGGLYAWSVTEMAKDDGDKATGIFIGATAALVSLVTVSIVF